MSRAHRVCVNTDHQNPGALPGATRNTRSVAAAAPRLAWPAEACAPKSPRRCMSRLAFRLPYLETGCPTWKPVVRFLPENRHPVADRGTPGASSVPCFTDCQPVIVNGQGWGGAEGIGEAAGS